VKVFLAIANRIYKGRGERFMSSRALLDSDLGKLCLMNFDEVTANTFQYLIEGSCRYPRAVGKIRRAGALHRLRLPRHRDTDRRQVPVARPTATTPRVTPRCALSAWRRTHGAGHQGHGVQLPGDTHQLIRHLRRRRAIAVPVAEGAQAGSGTAWPTHSGRPAAIRCRKAIHWRRCCKRSTTTTQAAWMQTYRNFTAWPMDNSAELADLMIGTSEEITQMHKDRKALVTMC